MIKLTYMSLKSRLLSTLPSRFIRNQDGIAAIEFAFIAPIMLFMYFGMAEVATAISVDRRISHSANVASDLATQAQTISADEMSEIMTATMLVMGVPDDKRDYVTIEIASYARAADDSIIEKGSAILKGSQGIDLPDFDASTLDTSLLSSSSGVVIARVNYIYEPLKLRYLPTNFNLSETFRLKPRNSINVDIIDPNGSMTYNCNFSGTDTVCTTS